MNIEMMVAIVTVMGASIGVTWKISQAIHNANEALYQKIDKRFDQIDKRFDQIEKRLDRFEAGQAELFRKVTQIEAVLWAQGFHPHALEDKKVRSDDQ